MKFALLLDKPGCHLISETKLSAIFDVLHLDVWDTYKVQTFDENRTFLTIVGDHSCMT